MNKYWILIPAGIIILLIFAWNIPVSTTSEVQTINLTCGNSPPAQVHIEVEGEIAPWTELGRNDFMLTGPAQVDVTLTIPV